jgi:hypothetical protein
MQHQSATKQLRGVATVFPSQTQALLGVDLEIAQRIDGSAQ